MSEGAFAPERPAGNEDTPTPRPRHNALSDKSDKSDKSDGSEKDLAEVRRILAPFEGVSPMNGGSMTATPTTPAEGYLSGTLSGAPTCLTLSLIHI